MRGKEEVYGGAGVVCGNRLVVLRSALGFWFFACAALMNCRDVWGNHFEGFGMFDDNGNLM